MLLDSNMIFFLHQAKNWKLEHHAEAIRFLRAEERERWSLKVRELTDESNKYHRLYQELLVSYTYTK
jgi:hypothetical protein